MRAHIEVRRGRGNVPLSCLVITYEFTQPVDGDTSGWVDREPERIVKRDVLFHEMQVMGLSALERKRRDLHPESALVPGRGAVQAAVAGPVSSVTATLLWP